MPASDPASAKDVLGALKVGRDELLESVKGGGERLEADARQWAHEMLELGVSYMARRISEEEFTAALELAPQGLLSIASEEAMDAKAIARRAAINTISTALGAALRVPPVTMAVLFS